MDHPTRNEFEHYCAPAEIEVDPDKFVEISRRIIRVLDEKQAILNRQRPTAGDGYLAGPLPRSSAPTDSNEKATLVRKSTNPSKLCQPALKVPVVVGSSEQLRRVLTQHSAWIRAQVFDAIFGKPALDLGQGVTVLLGMLILVPHPCLAPLWLALSVAQHRITRDESVPRQPSDEAPGPEGNACEYVVDPENNDPAGPRKAHEVRERRTRVWSVVQNP